MNRSLRNYGQSSSSRKIQKKGCTVKPSDPSGNHMNPLQGGNHICRSEGGNHICRSEGGNHLYPIHLGGDHMYPLPGRNRMIPIGGYTDSSFQGQDDVYKTYEGPEFADGMKLVINVFPPPPLPIFCAPSPRSPFLESLDNGPIEWVKCEVMSDEEHSRVIRELYYNNEALRIDGYKANKPAPPKGYSEYW